jgi:hypothetical protein
VFLFALCIMDRVIDALGGVTNADIAADRICSGDFDAIASLIT